MDEWDLSSAQSIGGMFSGCNLLTSISNIEDWNTEAVTDMSEVFKSCTSLPGIPDISGWETSHVTTMKGLFNNCTQITYPPNIDNWVTDELTDVREFFYYDGGLILLPTFSNWNMSKVTRFDSMFAACSKITTPPNTTNWDISSAANLSYMFSACENLIDPPDTSNWNVSKVTTIDHIFYNCTSLITPPNVSNWNTEKLSNTSYAFQNCIKWTTPPDVSGWKVNLVSNASYMFYRCLLMETAPNMSNWESVQIANMTYMFAGCEKLQSIDISRFSVTSTTNTGNMFNGCKLLEQLYCDNNWSETLQASRTSNMFSGCTKLPNFDPSKLDKTFAYPDNGVTGYFTPKTPIMTLNSFEGGHYEDISGNIINNISGNYNDNVQVKIVVTDNIKTVDKIIDNTENQYLKDSNNFITIPLWFNGSINITLKDKFLTFTSLENTLTVNTTNNGGNSPDVQWSSDGSTWQQLIGDAMVTGVGSKIYVKGNNPIGFSSSMSKYTNFNVPVGTCNVSGNVMSLLDGGAGTITAIPCNYCFTHLFITCTKIKSINAGLLPATTLADYCYNCMFYGCTGLKIRQGGTTGRKVFTCPSTTGITFPTNNMFLRTGGTFTGTPTAGNLYYNYD